MVPKTGISKSDRLLTTNPDKDVELEAAATLVRDEDEFVALDGEIEPAVEISEEDELLILSPLSDEFDEKVAEAQEQLLHLRHQQEQLEKQKAQLEELKRKREKFLRGRAEATDRLTKATTMLEREMFDAQKRLEQFGHARDAFDRHLATLEAINPDEWTRDEMRPELSQALAAIQDARDEYTSEMARIGAIVDVSAQDGSVAPLPVEVAAEDPVDQKSAVAARGNGAVAVPAAGSAPAEVRDFIYWLKSGFAFTLPLLIFGIFALFLVLVVF